MAYSGNDIGSKRFETKYWVYNPEQCANAFITLARQLLSSSLGTIINYQLIDIWKNRLWLDSEDIILSENLDTKAGGLSLCVMKSMGATKRCSTGIYQDAVNLRHLIKTK